MEEKLVIEYLGYIGGDDDGQGGYCEPIIIRTEGQEHYILHEAHTFSDSLNRSDIKMKHSKVEFSKLEELTSAFERVKARLTIDHSLPWIETDSSCGYTIPHEEWEKAHRRFRSY